MNTHPNDTAKKNFNLIEHLKEIALNKFTEQLNQRPPNRGIILNDMSEDEIRHIVDKKNQEASVIPAGPNPLRMNLFNPSRNHSAIQEILQSNLSETVRINPLKLFLECCKNTTENISDAINTSGYHAEMCQEDNPFDPNTTRRTSMCRYPDAMMNQFRLLNGTDPENKRLLVDFKEHFLELYNKLYDLDTNNSTKFSYEWIFIIIAITATAATLLYLGYRQYSQYQKIQSQHDTQPTSSKTETEMSLMQQSATP